ncbi:hypothetical protein TNCT_162491, partial [Trichonephila clavata]
MEELGSRYDGKLANKKVMTDQMTAVMQ